MCVTGSDENGDLLFQSRTVRSTEKRVYLGKLVEALKPERIYLFGSKARGEIGPDSDYDLMVVGHHAEKPGYRLAQNAHSLLWELGTAADILVWTRDVFDSRPHLKASLPATILREGTLLYGT